MTYQELLAAFPHLSPDLLAPGLTVWLNNVRAQMEDIRVPDEALPQLREQESWLLRSLESVKAAQ